MVNTNGFNVSNITPSEIVKKVSSHDDDTTELRTRMEGDYDRWKLTAYDAGADYASYTSNQPRVFAERVISWLVAAQLIIRMRLESQGRFEREQLDKKERLLIGVLDLADVRLGQMLMPSLREMLAWYVAIRGWWAVRALLVKEPDMSTRVDVMPWDPLHTFWGLGRHGLEWACYKQSKTKAEIRAEYGLETEGEDESALTEVYDYYDRFINSVVIEGEFVKPPTPHGLIGTVPVLIGSVGAAPFVQSWKGMESKDNLAEVGESVFAPNRVIYDNHNLMMSIWLELASRARKHPIVFKSPDGSKILEEDPYKEGSEISLAQGEEIQMLNLPEMTRDAAALMGAIAGEIQRGSIPYSVYGELQFQLSGYAVDTLQKNILSTIRPRSMALEKAYRGICHLLTTQYATGFYLPFEVTGTGNDKRWFTEVIMPEEILGLPDPEIRLVPVLPMDDMGKMVMAQKAREGPVPLLPDQEIWDKVLGIQDTDKLSDAIKEQLAERTSPMAAVHTLIMAALARGREDLARIYFGDMQDMMMQKQLQRMQMAGMMGPGMMGPGGPPSLPPGEGPPGGPGGSAMPEPGPGPTGIPPEIMSNAQLGQPPPQPVPQVGPIVPPGSPRPGAASPEERLRRIGLTMGR